MAKKVVRVAVWEYLNKQKKRRLAYFGDEVDLSAAEVKRGEAAGVFDQPVPVDPSADAAVSAVDQTVVVADDVPAAAADTADSDDLADLGDAGADDGAAASDDGADAKADVVVLEKPLNTAPPEAWVEYAVSKGFDRAEAEKMVAEDRPGLLKALA